MNLSQPISWVEQPQPFQMVFILSFFVLLSFLEKGSPRRPSKAPQRLRWFNNLGMAVLNLSLLRLISPGAALLAAEEGVAHHFGIFNWLEIPLGLSIFWSFVILDITLYYLHRLFHAQPLFWNIHKVHHADLDVDITTGVRFHPVEMMLRWGVKFTVILFWGMPVQGVLLFETGLAVSTLFTHSNLGISPVLDRILRLVFVTPDLHRIHHSQLPQEANSDFGFIFSIWDKLFGTYRAEPLEGQAGMKLGLEGYQEQKFLRGDQMLLMPFMNRKGLLAWKNLSRPD